MIWFQLMSIAYFIGTISSATQLTEIDDPDETEISNCIDDPICNEVEYIDSEASSRAIGGRGRGGRGRGFGMGGGRGGGGRGGGGRGRGGRGRGRGGGGGGGRLRGRGGGGGGGGGRLRGRGGGGSGRIRGSSGRSRGRSAGGSGRGKGIGGGRGQVTGRKGRAGGAAGGKGGGKGAGSKGKGGANQTKGGSGGKKGKGGSGKFREFASELGNFANDFGNIANDIGNIAGTIGDTAEKFGLPGGASGDTLGGLARLLENIPGQYSKIILIIIKLVSAIIEVINDGGRRSMGTTDCAGPNCPKTPPKPEILPGVFPGSDVKYEYPSETALGIPLIQLYQMGPLCAGFHIKPWIIITTADCVTRENPSLLFATVSIKDYENKPYTRLPVQVQSYVVHPKYNASRLENNIAIVQIYALKKWNAGDFYLSPELSAEEYNRESNNTFVNHWAAKNPEELHVVTVPVQVLNQSVCHVKNSTEMWYCVKSLNKEDIYILSDIGIPVFGTVDNRKRVLGLYTGTDTGEIVTSHLFQSLSSSKSWIDDFIKNNPDPPVP